MKHKTLTTKSRQFLREYPRFKRFVAQGGKVTITDRGGHQFVFTRVGNRQHPPRQAPHGLDPKAFTGIDLDEPAISALDWEANR